MDERRFDGMARTWGEAGTRRGALGLLAGLGLSALAHPVASRKRHKSKSKRRKAQLKALRSGV